ELAGAADAMGDATDVVLGSSKANVGHTMSAAGVAGVIRAALAIHTRTLPPMAGFETPKPELELEKTPFRIPVTAEDWAADERVAGVSSFGFGGTNVHAVLRNADAAPAVAQQAELVLMSAPNQEALLALAAHTADAIAADSSITVSGVARAWATRDRQPARLAVVASTRDELIAGLREPTLVGTAPETPPRVAFMYPGQGSQRCGMLGGITERFPVAAEVLKRIDDALDFDLHATLYPRVKDAAAEARLTATEHCQPALLAVGTALTEVLATVGINPTEVLGHSVGEFTAAVAGGVLSPEDGARWVRARGLAMSHMEGDRGAMLALRATAVDARALLVDGAVVANINHPKQTVISGSSDAIAQVAKRAEAAGVRSIALTVSHGFHSPVFERLDLQSEVAALTLQAPTVPVVSCIKDGQYESADDARSVFEAHATAPVEFVRTLRNTDADILLQVGAGGPLLSFARASLRGRNDISVVSLASTDDDDGGASLLRGLGQLWTLGVDVDVRAISSAAPVASVPPRQLPREVYWPLKDTGIALHLSDAVVQAPLVSAVANSATETGRVSDLGIASKVFEAVARASAYPVASLRADMSLTSDLGFDSMMLAELTTELTQAIDGLDGIPQELLINQPTIGDLVAFAESPTQAVIVDDDAPLERYASAWYPMAPRPRVERSRPVLEFHFETGVTVGAVLAGEADAPDPVAEFLELARGRTNEQPDVLVVTRDGDPWADGLAGACRALALDWPDARVKCVRTDGPLDNHRGELTDLDETVDVRWTNVRREVLGTTPVSADTSANWNAANEVVLVTGGSRGIGSSLSDRLETLGATVIRLGRAQADVTDVGVLTAFLSTHPPVTTLVHAAGVLADGPLESVDGATAFACRSVKVDGLVAAIVACGTSLKTVLGLGSWAGRFGNRHQIHYAAANAQLSGLIESLPPQIRGVVSEFGPWTDSDMVAQIPDSVRGSMRASGVDFVGQVAGLDAIIADLTDGTGVNIRGRRVPMTLGRLTDSERLSTESHPYLSDHAVDGRPVLPLAGAAAMMADAIGRPCPLTLTDITLFAPVGVTDSVATETRVNRQTVEIWADGALAYRASFQPSGEGHDTWREGGESPKLSLQSFYDDHTFHGPLLQGITHLDSVGVDFIQGRLKRGERSDWVPAESESWQVDPLVLDSAMQLTAYVAFTRFGRAGTPVSIGKLTQLAPFQSGELSAQAIFEPGDGDRFSARLAVFNPDGSLAMVAEDVVAKLQAVETSEDAPDAPVKSIWADPAQWPEYLE
ncbi:MAG: malonyl CoA-acyl carrier protein transacylase, partial [Myxococcota bacterium]